MGNPNHYSLELPDRCLQLINGLWPTVQQLYEPGRPDAGPLTTTFLVAMAMPIVILPVERLHKPQTGRPRIADDRHLNPDLAAAMAYVISDLELRRTPFFASNTWSYVNWPGYLNIGQRLPPDLCAQLSSDDAYESAASLPSVTWSDALRNALAHGCIAYLNESGFDTMGEQASMLCFLSEKRTRGELPSTHCLRISEEDFKHFLHSWVEWLNGSGLMRLMAAE